MLCQWEDRHMVVDKPQQDNCPIADFDMQKTGWAGTQQRKGTFHVHKLQSQQRKPDAELQQLRLENQTVGWQIGQILVFVAALQQRLRQNLVVQTCRRRMQKKQDLAAEDQTWIQQQTVRADTVDTLNLLLLRRASAGPRDRKSSQQMVE